MVHLLFLCLFLREPTANMLIQALLEMFPTQRNKLRVRLSSNIGFGSLFREIVWKSYYGTEGQII